MYKKTFKKLLAMSLISIFAIFALVACGEKKEEATTANTEQAKVKRIALITDVVGTQSFLIDMVNGFNESAKKWGFEPIVAECADPGAYEDNARALLEEGVDMIIGGGWQAVDVMEKIAKEFPDKADYAIVDAEVQAPNVKSITFREQEGAYIVGKMAALITKQDNPTLFGAVHVFQGPGSWKWRWGYMEGVKSVLPEAKFTFNFIGNFNDPAKAKEFALQQAAAGCQFINACAAGGDKGIFEAAKEKHFFTSGQDIDLTTPDNEWIVSSQIKDTKQTMINLLDEYYGDNWNTNNEEWGVSDGTIGAVFVTHDSKNPINPRMTEEVVKELKDTVEKIKSKDIDLKVMPEEKDYKF